MRETFCGDCGMTMAGPCSHPKCPKRPVEPESKTDSVLKVDFINTCPTENTFLWMAGDYDQAKQILREYCSKNGACFSITKCDYVYSGGEESGFRIDSISYPRFPSEVFKRHAVLERLGIEMMKKLNQKSFTIQTPRKSVYYSVNKD